MSIIFFNKAWTWIKNHWYLPLIFLVIGLYFLLRRSPDKRLLDLIEKQRDNYRKEIEIIKNTAEQEKKQKENLKEKHEQAIKNIEKEYNVKIEELEEAKKNEIDSLAKKYQDRPDDLAKAVASALSSEYTRIKWEEKSD